MDSQGRKVIVVDNGTGVSCKILSHFIFKNSVFAVRQMRVCRNQFPSSYIPFNGRSANREIDTKSWKY